MSIHNDAIAGLESSGEAPMTFKDSDPSRGPAGIPPSETSNQAGSGRRRWDPESPETAGQPGSAPESPETASQPGSAPESPETAGQPGSVPESPETAGQPAPGRRRLEPESLAGHVHRLYRAAYGLCGSRELAEDLVQDTFERVLRRPRFLRREQDLSYLLRVLRNTWISSRRSGKPITYIGGEDELDALGSHHDPIADKLDARVLYDSLQDLSPPLREAVVAVDVLGLSYKDAARALKTREGTIMSRLHRGRGQLAAQLPD